MSPNGTNSMELVFPSTTDKVITVIQLVYGIPSFLLLIFFLFFLGIGKNYKNSFYRLVQLDLITNILCYFNTWIELRMEKHPAGVMILKSMESTIPGILSFAKLLITFFMHMQFCSAIALNIHRITSVVYFDSHEKSWSRYYSIFGVISAIYSTLPLLSISGRMVDIEIINGTLMTTYHTEVMEKTFFQVAAFSVIYFALLLIIGIATFIIVSKKIRSVTSDDRGISKKLTKIALTYCFVYSGILLFGILGTLNEVFGLLPDILVEYTPVFLVFFSDMITLALPYILLINDLNVRRDLKEFFQTPVEVVQVNSASIS